MLLLEFGAGGSGSRSSSSSLSALCSRGVWLNSYDVWPAALAVAALWRSCWASPWSEFKSRACRAAKVYAVLVLVPAALYVAARWGWRRLAWCCGAFVLRGGRDGGAVPGRFGRRRLVQRRSQVERGLRGKPRRSRAARCRPSVALRRVGRLRVRTEAGPSRGHGADALAAASSIAVIAAGTAVGSPLRGPSDRQRLTVSFAAGWRRCSFRQGPCRRNTRVAVGPRPTSCGRTRGWRPRRSRAAFLLARLWFHHYDRLFAVEGTVWLDCCAILRSSRATACCCRCSCAGIACGEDLTKR